MGPSALLPNDGNPSCPHIRWLTGHHQLGQGNHCSLPTRALSLVQGITKAYFKLPGSHLQSHLSWTQLESRPSFKISTRLLSRFWLVFRIFRWPFGHLWFLPAHLSYVIWGPFSPVGYMYCDFLSNSFWIADLTLLVHDRLVWMWLNFYMMRRYSDGNTTYYCMPFPPATTGCDSLLTICYLLWCNPSWVDVINALWFLIRITRTNFFFLKKSFAILIGKI